MFSKEEKKEINTAFWKGFRSKMKCIPNAEGKFINWLNYPTQLKPFYLRLFVDQKHARVSLDIQIKDEGVRQLVWEQMTELQKVLENETGPADFWHASSTNEVGQEIAQIIWIKQHVSLYNKKNHTEIYSFFEDQLLGFDRFYQDYKEILFGLLK